MKNIERVAELIEKKGISVRAFERSIGASNATIANAIKKKTDISSELLSKIIGSYPDISTAWLLTGEGDMYASSVGDVNGNSNIINQGNIHGGVHSDNRQYYSDSPDVLKEKIDQLEAMIREKETRIAEKDKQIAEKDKQIAEKDKQIAGLIAVLTK